jgi:hypothetical protein
MPYADDLVLQLGEFAQGFFVFHVFETDGYYFSVD